MRGMRVFGMDLKLGRDKLKGHQLAIANLILKGELSRFRFFSSWTCQSHAGLSASWGTKEMASACTAQPQCLGTLERPSPVAPSVWVEQCTNAASSQIRTSPPRLFRVFVPRILRIRGFVNPLHLSMTLLISADILVSRVVKLDPRIQE